MAEQLMPIMAHVFPGLCRGGGPVGYAFNLKQALDGSRSADRGIVRIVIPPQTGGGIRQGDAFSWRFEILRRMPGIVSAWVLLKQERHMRRHAIEKLRFPLGSVEQMRTAKVVAFHDVRIMASYLFAFGKAPGQTVLLMPHSGNGLSAEVVRNWRIYMKQSGAWDQAYRYLVDDELQTILLADGLIAPYKDALDSFLDGHPNRSLLFSKPIYEIPTGVPPLKSTKDRERVLMDLGIPPDKTVIGFFGRHHIDKGYDYFCECAERAMTDGSDNLFFVTGGSGPVKSPNTPNFKDLGYITSELGNVMGAVDLVVSPSRVSYFELSILEAMSLGKPILATKIGGSKRLKAPGVFLMEEVSGPLLLAQIYRLTSDISLLREMGKQNLIAYQRDYDLAVFAKRHVALAERLVRQEG